MPSLEVCRDDTISGIVQWGIEELVAFPPYHPLVLSPSVFQGGKGKVCRHNITLGSASEYMAIGGKQYRSNLEVV
jgi:hypothetical protein